MRRVRTHTFNGVKYNIDVYEPFDEVCESPREKKDQRPHIRVALDINTKAGMIALFHGCFHAENWAKSEEVVDRCAVEIGTLFWRLGYRRNLVKE